jgi:hypothetical protein
MSKSVAGRRHGELTAKQMHLMAKIAQAYGRLIEISFRPAFEI